ncbi:MAG: phosphopyruvate hydratase [Betaproteobacteria bacterium RIFCSPLOWO2_02_FULL_62_17]|nr:MAG: phosphopyruvate hydratase [Betaproteobacteria bacterium RIFCSPLOWO2_02_FULL_62_17]
MRNRIQSVNAMEILDSRGFPTVRVNVVLDDGTVGTASIPSGASTGENEATELRDGDPKRYSGKGVLTAVKNVNTEIHSALAGCEPLQQAQIDRILIDLDGTDNKSRLGANATLGASQAVARAAAQSCGLPLYVYLGGVGAVHLPVPMMNVLNGGKHADSSLDFQEFMIMPKGAPTLADALRYGAETFQALKKLLHGKGYATSVGDEGGFAPQLKGGNEEACELIVAAIEKAGYRAGKDIVIALDPAASSFYEGGKYRLTRSGQGDKSSAEMIALFEAWVRRYPIVSIEDGLAENDWAGFAAMTAAMGGDIQIVGDDLLVTNPQFVARGIAEKSCNAALIKLNQIGTVSETVAAIHLCRKAGWGFVISHRSGETEDTFMADFAVAMGGGQIKTGSMCRSERIAKYNRLLEIEAELGDTAGFGS